MGEQEQEEEAIEYKEDQIGKAYRLIIVLRGAVVVLHVPNGIIPSRASQVLSPNTFGLPHLKGGGQ